MVFHKVCEQKQLICQGYPLKPRTFYSKEAIQTRVVGEWLCIGLLSKHDIEFTNQATGTAMLIF